MKKFENQLFFRKENTIAIAPGFTLSEGIMRNEVQLKHFREISAKARTLVRDEQPKDLVGAAIFLQGRIPV